MLLPKVAVFALIAVNCVNAGLFSCKQTATYTGLSSAQVQALEIVDNNTKSMYARCLDNLEKERKLFCQGKMSESMYTQSASNCMNIIFTRSSGLTSILRLTSDLVVSKDFKHAVEIEGPVSSI